MSILCLIYRIRNIVNNQIYIGQTWGTIHRRWNQHCVPSKYKSKLFNAISKYGKDKFVIDVLCVASTQNIANYWEDYFITKFDSVKCGYNIRDGGSRGKHSDKTKIKMSSSAKGRIFSKEQLAKFSAAKIGHKFNIGRKHSLESRKKISKVLKGKTRSANSINNMKRAQRSKFKNESLLDRFRRMGILK